MNHDDDFCKIPKGGEFFVGIGAKKTTTFNDKRKKSAWIARIK
jgi:hypothetical protein